MTDLTERLERCYSGVVFDVLRGQGISDCVLPADIRPLDPSKKLAGPVFTARGSPKPGMDAHESLIGWTGFLSQAPAGYVAVMEGNDLDRALMGELSAETLKNKGVKGYVTDGGCRDCSFIQQIGLPVFSSFFTPRDIVGAWSPDVLDEPIQIGDVNISPGDFLIGDMDGVVIIPVAIAEEIIGEAETAIATENDVRTAILDGVDPKEAYLRYGKF